jgi:AraC-like DNA-binding protein
VDVAGGRRHIVAGEGRLIDMAISPRDPGSPVATSTATSTVRLSILSGPDASSDHDEFGGASVVPLGKPPFEARLLDLDLGDVVVRIGRCSPAVAIGRLDAACSGIAVPIDGIEGLVVGGHDAMSGCIVLCGPGGAYEAAARAPLSWATIILRYAGDAAPASMLAPAAWLRAGVCGVARVHPGALQHARTLIRDLEAVASLQPDVFEVDEARRSVRASALEMVHSLVSGADMRHAHRNARQVIAARRQLVHLADAAIRADPARVRGARSLATVLGVAQRDLRDAFMATLGVGMGRYLLLRRLALAFAAMRDAHADPEMVARAHGFPSVGHFRQLYASRFGCMPGR